MGSIHPLRRTASRPERLVLCLYVAGASPNSERARANLREIIEQTFPDGCQLEVVDVLVDTERALRDQILVTPTLLKLAPAPTTEVVGDLSQRAQVLLALGR
ncbi:MAG: circadian clock KaiB family protein [Anaerolineales bacterium]